MLKSRRTLSRAMPPVVNIFGLLLLLALPGLFGTAVAQPRNLDIIVQRDGLEPPTTAQISLVWDGGSGPWSWVIEVDGIKDGSLRSVTAPSQCDDPELAGNCRSAAFFRMFDFAEIVTIRATVTDAQDQTVSATRRIRIAGNEPFWIESVTPARIEPAGGGKFSCYSDNENDPPWITLSGDDRSFPLIDVFRDPRISRPYALTTWDITPDPDNPAAEILYIIRRTDRTDDFRDVLAFPMQYGSLQVDSQVLPEPPIAPLRAGRLYLTRMTGEPFPCESVPTQPQISFMINPPAPGDAVIVQGPAEALEGPDSDPSFAEILDRPRQILLDPREEAFAACVKKSLGFSIIAFIAAKSRSNQVLGLVEDLTFDIVTDPETVDLLQVACAAALAPKANEAPNSARSQQAASQPAFDLELTSGNGRVTLADPEFVSEIRTAHGAVVTSGGVLDIAQSADDRRSTIGSPDKEITVTPANPALPQTLVPAGFFVILSDTSVSDPTEFTLFSDGFE